MDNQSIERKSTPFLSWLGFSFSLIIFLLMLLIVSVAKSNDTDAFSLIALMVTFGGCFWILGLVFSISGLKIASRNNSSKWVGWSGITFSVLSILMLILPLVFRENNRYDYYYDNQDLILGLSGNNTMESKSDETLKDVKNDIILTIPEYGKIKCLDNRKGADSYPANLSKYGSSFRRELSTWFQVNKVDKKASILIRAERDSDYSDVVTVIENLKKLGYNNYTVESK